MQLNNSPIPTASTKKNKIKLQISLLNSLNPARVDPKATKEKRILPPKLEGVVIDTIIEKERFNLFSI
jgi:hypothetical protein